MAQMLYYTPVIAKNYIIFYFKAVVFTKIFKIYNFRNFEVFRKPHSREKLSYLQEKFKNQV